MVTVPPNNNMHQYNIILGVRSTPSMLIYLPNEWKIVITLGINKAKNRVANQFILKSAKSPPAIYKPHLYDT